MDKPGETRIKSSICSWVASRFPVSKNHPGSLGYPISGNQHSCYHIIMFGQRKRSKPPMPTELSIEFRLHDYGQFQWPDVDGRMPAYLIVTILIYFGCLNPQRPYLFFYFCIFLPLKSTSLASQIHNLCRSRPLFGEIHLNPHVCWWKPHLWLVKRPCCFGQLLLLLVLIDPANYLLGVSQVLLVKSLCSIIFDGYHHFPIFSTSVLVKPMFFFAIEG